MAVVLVVMASLLVPMAVLRLPLAVAAAPKAELLVPLAVALVPNWVWDQILDPHPITPNRIAVITKKLAIFPPFIIDSFAYFSGVPPGYYYPA
jgi:hypothetical protein